jgi:hypothetical protein
VNAAHTERTEGCEILLKTSADVTSAEIRRRKRRTVMKGAVEGGDIWHFGYTADHKIILKAKDMLSIHVA